MSFFTRASPTSEKSHSKCTEVRRTKNVFLYLRESYIRPKKSISKRTEVRHTKDVFLYSRESYVRKKVILNARKSDVGKKSFFTCASPTSEKSHSKRTEVRHTKNVFLYACESYVLRLSNV